MAVVAMIFKIVGAVVTLISGLTALNYQTRSEHGLTLFGKLVLAALVLGSVSSACGVVLDWYVKNADDAKQAVDMRQLRLRSDAARFTTADAKVTIIASVDKSVPELAKYIARLDSALAHAKGHCRQAGDEARCGDFVFRAVIIDEVRFSKQSSLFPSLRNDKQAFAIMTGLGVIVRFYNERFTPTLDLADNSLGGILTESTISGNTLFEFDGNRLRSFITGKLPPEAFKYAGVLSLVDLVGNGASIRPYLKANSLCANEPPGSDCGTNLVRVLRAIKVEDVEICFPHRKNIQLDGLPENRSTDAFGVPYVFQNFPEGIDAWERSEEAC
jgi:hypothetical protein